MAVSYYMDHNVPRAITVGLRMRGVDVVTAFDDKKPCTFFFDLKIAHRQSEINRLTISDRRSQISDCVPS